MEVNLQVNVKFEQISESRKKVHTEFIYFNKQYGFYILGKESKIEIYSNLTETEIEPILNLDYIDSSFEDAEKAMFKILELKNFPQNPKINVLHWKNNKNDLITENEILEKNLNLKVISTGDTHGRHCSI